MSPPAAPRNEPSRGLQACLLGVAAIYILVHAIGSIWSNSADLAHHYALVARLSEYWTLPAGQDPSLGEMNSYPRTSHAMAAIAGSWFDSPLIGMQLVGLGSIIVLWASFIHMLQSLPGRLAARALLAFVVLLVLNRVLFRFEIHGREIVGSYFYAQLVAQAVAAFALAVALAMDRRGIEAPTRYAVLLALAYFCMGIHVLPALQLLCLLLLLAGLEFLARSKDGAGGNLRRGLVAMAFMVGGIALLVRHPAFSAMAGISRNNGAFAPTHLDGIGVIGAYAACIAVASAAIVHHWFRSRHGASAGASLLLKYLGLYGMAVAGLCLAQVLALKFGQGSEYAIKKHVFALNTVALLELAIVPALLGLRTATKDPGTQPANDGFVFAYLVLPVLTVVAFYGIAPRKPVGDTAGLVRLERVLQRHRDALLALAPAKFAYLMPGPGIPPVVAYMLSTGILGSPRGPGTEGNALSILRGEPLSDWPAVGTILQPGPLQSGQPAACQRPFPDLPFSVLDGQCVARAAARASSVVPFTAAKMPSPCTLTGFGDPEASFTWTTQLQAAIDCPIPDVGGRPARSVTIYAGAFLDRVPFQRASVSVNGGPAREFRFDQATTRRAITLALPADAGAALHIRLGLPDAISPKDAGVSADARRLGLSIARLEFQ